MNGKDQPVMEVTVEYLVCKCCENPDEPVIRCTECPVDVCMDCMDHKHHDTFIDTEPKRWNAHYGPDGKLITFCRWVQLVESQESKRVVETTIGKRYWVSTVWLGLDHNYGKGLPLIFETMVFPKGGWGELDVERYETIEGAKRGHERMVKKWWRRRRGLKGRDEGLPKLPKAQ